MRDRPLRAILLTFGERRPLRQKQVLLNVVQDTVADDDDAGSHVCSKSTGWRLKDARLKMHSLEKATMKNFSKNLRQSLRFTKLGQTLLFAENYLKKISAVLSYPKCGRTWVATVMMHYVGKHRGLINDPRPFSLNPNRDNPELFVLGRRAFFSHDIMSAKTRPDELIKRFSLRQYANKPIAFIVRDPRDVVVSYYHHVKKKRSKTNIPEKTSLYEFIHMPEFGLERIVAVYNRMYELSKQQENIRFFRYEDLHGPEAYAIDAWEELFSFVFQTTIDQDALGWALEVSGFDQMKDREAKDREAKGNAAKPDERRVRKGKVGGYKDEMSLEAQAYVDQFIEENLHDFFGSYKYSGESMPKSSDNKISV